MKSVLYQLRHMTGLKNSRHFSSKPIVAPSHTFPALYIREVKHYVNCKRQTTKIKLLPSLFSCLYSRMKLFVFTMNSRRRYSISVCFIYGLEEKNFKSEVIVVVTVCRLPLTPRLTSLSTTCNYFKF